MFLSVYKIENERNGKIYIGCTSNPRKRLRTHKNDLAQGKHPQKDFQADYDNGDKFTACELFAVSIADTFDPYLFGGIMHSVEAHYTIKYNSDINGYNIRHCGAWRNRQEAEKCKPDLESIRAKLKMRASDWRRWGYGNYYIKHLQIVYNADSPAENGATVYKPCIMEIYKGQPHFDTHGQIKSS